MQFEITLDAPVAQAGTYIAPVAPDTPDQRVVETVFDGAAPVAMRRAENSGQAAWVFRLAAGDALIFDMVKVIYKDVDARLHPAAARSVLAHMIYLVEAGGVVAEGPLELSTRYRLAA